MQLGCPKIQPFSFSRVLSLHHYEVSSWLPQLTFPSSQKTGNLGSSRIQYISIYLYLYISSLVLALLYTGNPDKSES